MLDTWRTLIRNQFEAVLCNLCACIDRCPEELWHASVVNLKYCQVAFHTLFFTNYYLDHEEGTFRQQAFHRDNPGFFRDYEELQDRQQELLYDRIPVRDYLTHCREKAADVLAGETEATLAAWCGFQRREFARAELHLYNIRHIQHHATQLGMRLRTDAGEGIPWFGSGWCDK